MGGPGVNAEAAFPSNLGNEVFVEDFEEEAKALLEFLLPLEQHRRRAGHYDFANLLAHQQLPRNQACLYGFAQTDVIGDKQIHPWQSQRLPQWFELVGVKPDTRTERGLQEGGVC